MGAYDKIKRGRAPDLGPTWFRSAWERNCARWLQLRVNDRELAAWRYESYTFTFPGVISGPACYTPDFELFYPDLRVEWLEVKGREVSRDRTKWKRLRRYYPHVVLTVLGAAEYKRLQAQVGPLIPEWEY